MQTGWWKRTWHNLRRRPQLLALGGYVLLSLLLLSPVLPSFDRAILGGPIAEADGWQNVWNLWWTGKALAKLQNPFVTTMLYYPTGVSLYLQTFNITNGLLGLWLTWLAGPIAAYNFCVLAAFVLTGWGTYLLARRLTDHEGASFVAGLLFTFSPFHLTKLVDGQLEHIALQWIPFFLLFLLRAVEDGRRRDILWTALFLALVALTSWYQALFCGILGGLFLVLWAIVHRRRARQILGRGLAGLVGGIVLLLPILVPALVGMAPDQDSATPEEDQYLTSVHSADLLDGLLPSPLHPLWGDWAYQVGMRWHPEISSPGSPLIAGWNLSLGYAAIALAGWGLVTAWRQGWPWAALALGMGLLALGPTLQLAGQDTGIPTPHALLQVLPIAGMAHRPSHFALLSILLLDLLAAFGLKAALLRLRPRGRYVLAALALALIALEYVPRPLPLLQPQVHPYYASLSGGEGAVLDLPARHESSAPLLAQIVHGRPIAGGYVSRTPLYLFSANAPGMRHLWQIQPFGPDVVKEDPDVGLVALRAYGFRYVVIHWEQLRPRQQEEMAAVLHEVLGDELPAFQDGQVSFYELPEETPLRPFVYLGSGWYALGQNESQHWRWSGAEVELHLVNPCSQTVGITLQARWRSYLRQRSLAIDLNGRWLGQADAWPDPSRLYLQMALAPGEHVLSFQVETDVEPVPPYRDLGIAWFSVILDDTAPCPGHGLEIGGSAWTEN